MTPAPRAPGAWFWTRARPKSRPCDGCRRRTRKGDRVAYRAAWDGRPATLLCVDCAQRRRVLPREASTPEARGQEVIGQDRPAARAGGPRTIAEVLASDPVARAIAPEATPAPAPQPEAPPAWVGLEARRLAALRSREVADALDKMETGLLLVQQALQDATRAARELAQLHEREAR